MKFNEITLLTTATLTALMAGLLFSYSISVTFGLGKLADMEYLKAMQSINKEIQNPIFFICFFGALLMLPFSTILNYNHQKSMYILLLCASISYIIGVFGVTIFGNVPLNNQLAKLNTLNETIENIKLQRMNFENNWNFLNNIRTIFSIVSIVLVICACLLNKPTK